MSKKDEIDSSPEDETLDHILRVMRENEHFLRLNASDVYGEIIDFANDAIDYLPNAKRGATVESLTKFSISYFINHILMPLGGAMYIDLLTGNLPVCFTQLRTALEALVQSYLADAKYPEMDFFGDKLSMLENEKERTSKHINEFDESLDLGKKSIALWGKLSNDWVHPRGITERTLTQLSDKSDVPSWALVIPIYYTLNDLESLEELQKRVSDFKTLLVAALQKSTNV